MAGYSSTPLINKLGIKENTKMFIMGEPENFRKELGPLPSGTIVARKLGEKVDYVHLFTTKRSELEDFFRNIKRYIYKEGQVWISWPKQSAKKDTDLNENIVRDIGLKNGMVDVKVAAIDDIWSGLKFVYRLKDR